MRIIGYSTGALAYEDFRRGVEILRNTSIEAIELSALRESELQPLLDGLGELNLAQFRYVSLHAPSAFVAESEARIVALLGEIGRRGWPIILHPDAIHDFALWRHFGPRLCIENMDRRKPRGRTVQEIENIFDELPEASLCFDIGHAQQVDTTMATAHFILKRFRSRLRQIHLSEVNTKSKHVQLSYGAILAFQKVSSLVPENVPVILETPVAQNQIDSEMDRAKQALPLACTDRMKQLLDYPVQIPFARW